MKVLITGITGFAGSHLAELALKKGVDVFGTVRWRSRLENIEQIKNDVKLVDCDMRDFCSVKSALKKVNPDYIFHLAAQSFVPSSWSAPHETMTTNIIGQLNFFEAIRDLGINPVMQIACSSEEYGFVHPEEVPITEENPLRPLSPYAVSKVAQDMMGYQYYKSYGLKIVRTRGFNHTGPRRGEVFVTSNFAKQIAEIETGKREKVIHVGNLDARRDFSDVRDIVRAYWLTVEKGEPGEVYNVASGIAYKISEILKKLLSFSSINVDVVQQQERMRPSDVEVLLGSYEKFNKRTGWKPEIPFDRTLSDLLDYWRARV